MPNPLITLIHPTGNPTFPRFIIAEKKGEVWTGTGWSADRREGILFADKYEAARVCQAILRQEYTGKAVHHFTVPIKFEILSEGGVDPDVLKGWLKKALRLFILYGDFGNGPTEGSLVLVEIHWGELEEQ